MAEQWIIRVEGKEYGPADLATLHEWKADGRVLPNNPARPIDVDLWKTAGEIPGLFQTQPPPVQTDVGRQRSEVSNQQSAISNQKFESKPPSRNVLVETFRIYFRGFFQFFGLALLSILPILCAEFTSFFINVLFWQQFAVLENASATDALRESRNLARSGNDLSWYQRPMWRGAFIVSIWYGFLIALGLSVLWPRLAAEWPVYQDYFNQLTQGQDPQAVLQKINATLQTSHGFDYRALLLNIGERILQPLLGIAFVVLYLDSKRDTEV